MNHICRRKIEKIGLRSKISALKMLTEYEVKMGKYHLFKFRGRQSRPSKKQISNPLLPIANVPKPKALTELPANSHAEGVDVVVAAAVVDAEAARGEAPNSQLPFIDLLLTARKGPWFFSK